MVDEHVVTNFAVVIEALNNYASQLCDIFSETIIIIFLESETEREFRIR